MIQNLLRALNPGNLACLQQDVGLRECLGHEVPGVEGEREEETGTMEPTDLSGDEEGDSPDSISDEPPANPSYKFGDRVFQSLDAAEHSLGPEVDNLPLPVATEATGEVPQPRARQAGRSGVSRFTGSETVVGRLGERYAKRWLERGPQRQGYLVWDVSTSELRRQAQAGFPANYKGDSTISPGCDLLVFEQGPEELPIGYEVKTRQGDGDIAFEWSRREAEACRRAGQKETDPTWPLADYRVILISNLLSSQPPRVTILNREECLKGVEPTKFIVRAKELA
jgi:hypothetical protein